MESERMGLAAAGLLFAAMVVCAAGTDNADLPPQFSGEAEDISETLAALNASNIAIAPVESIFWRLPRFGWPPVCYWVTAAIPRGSATIDASFYLQGNTSRSSKARIINEELNDVRSFVDRCQRLGYRNLSIRMEPVAVPLGRPQKRTWIGTGRLPLEKGYAVVSLTPDSSAVDSTPSTAEQKEYESVNYVREKRELGEYLVSYAKIDGVKFGIGQRRGLQYVNCGPCTNCYMPGGNCNYRFEKIWIKAECSGLLAGPRLAKMEKVAQGLQGGKFTFVNNSVIDGKPPADYLTNKRELYQIEGDNASWADQKADLAKIRKDLDGIIGIATVADYNRFLEGYARKNHGLDWYDDFYTMSGTGVWCVATKDFALPETNRTGTKIATINIIVPEGVRYLGGGADGCVALYFMKDFSTASGYYMHTELAGTGNKVWHTNDKSDMADYAAHKDTQEVLKHKDVWSFRENGGFIDKLGQEIDMNPGVMAFAMR